MEVQITTKTRGSYYFTTVTKANLLPVRIVICLPYLYIFVYSVYLEWFSILTIESNQAITLVLVFWFDYSLRLAE